MNITVKPVMNEHNHLDDQFSLLMQVNFHAREYCESCYTFHCYHWCLGLCQCWGSTLNGDVCLLSIFFFFNSFVLVKIQNSKSTERYTLKSLVPHLPRFPSQFLLCPSRYIQCTYISDYIHFPFFQMIPYSDCSIPFLT